jgi:mannose/fructose-specific phosphotransferase system component IIA
VTFYWPCPQCIDPNKQGQAFLVVVIAGVGMPLLVECVREQKESIG